MSYSLNVMKDLVQSYPSWSELKTFLTSIEGGLLHISDVANEFCIIRMKHTPTRTVPHTKWFRSTVWNMETNRPVSIAPPKVSTQLPYVTCQEMTDAGLFCQEFLDGFMINCFKTIASDDVYITSRSKLDATGHFYSSKSFRELFQESYAGDVRNLPGPDPLKGELSVSYSFLVQHQEHRVVTPITENKTFLIQKVTCMEDGSVTVEDNRSDLPDIAMDPEMEFSSWLQQFFMDKTWAFQGVVVKDTAGNRWRFRNDQYMHVKTLRGNTANHLERFAQLYVKNATHDYLQYYPLDSFTFVCNNVFMNMIHQMVYNYYVQVHITKTIPMSEVEPLYRRHVYTLHRHYMMVLRPLKKKITYNEVASYFFQQPWQTLAYLLRNNQDSYFSQMSELVSQ